VSRLPHVGRRAGMVLVTFVALAAFSGCRPVAPPPPHVAAEAAEPAAPPPEPIIHDDIDAMVWRFGAPDARACSIDEEPRPLIQVYRMTYQKEDVSVCFAPANTSVALRSGHSQPPPYRDWEYMAAFDAAITKQLTWPEVLKRLAGRDRGRAPAELIVPGAHLSGKP